MNNNRRQLKNFIINREFQFKIIFYNVIYLFLASLITAVIILFPEIIKMNSSSVSDIEKFNAATNFLQLSGRIIPALFILSIIAFVHMIVFTHRICGPVISFTKAVKEFKKGNLKARIKLRKKDFLTEQSERVNEILDDFTGYLAEIHSDIEKLEEKVSDNPELINEVDRLKKKLKYLKI